MFFHGPLHVSLRAERWWVSMPGSFGGQEIEWACLLPLRKIFYEATNLVGRTIKHLRGKIEKGGTMKSFCAYLCLRAVIPWSEFLASEEGRITAFGAYSTMFFEEHLNPIGGCMHRTVWRKTTTTGICWFGIFVTKPVNDWPVYSSEFWILKTVFHVSSPDSLAVRHFDDFDPAAELRATLWIRGCLVAKAGSSPLTGIHFIAAWYHQVNDVV